jgi:Flp pilus assembly secretin CpaC
MRPTLSNAGRAGLALLSGALAASVPAAAPAAEVMPVVTVLVDNAKVIRLPEKTQTVIVGNPFIADFTLTSKRNGVVVLTGKSFGSTNLIALDEAGTLIAETMIRVEAARDATITVQRGLDRESLSCTPKCQPAVQLGDAAAVFNAASGQADTRRKLATGKEEADDRRPALPDH